MSAPVGGGSSAVPPQLRKKQLAPLAQPQNQANPPADLDKGEFIDSSSSAAAADSDEVLLATAGYDHTIKFWSAPTGQCTKTIQHADSQVNALDISPDGQLLAACGYQHIRMYDVHGHSTNPVVNYEGVSKNVMDVGFQEHGRWIYTGGEDGTVKIWDPRARNLQCQKIFNAHAPVNSVCLHPNQQELIIGDQNGIVHIWNVRSEHTEQLVTANGVSVQSVSVDSRGKRLAAITNKGNCHVWDLSSSSVPPSPEVLNPPARTVAGEPKTVAAHKRYGLKCKFSPDCSLLATSSADQTAKIWRTKDYQLITELHVNNQRWVWDIAFSADSQYLVTASSDNIARLWSLPANEVKKEYVGHQKALTCLAFRDGQSM